MTVVTLREHQDGQDVSGVTTAICHRLGFRFVDSGDHIFDYDPKTNSWQITFSGLSKSWEIVIRRSDTTLDLWFALASDGEKSIPLRVDAESKVGWTAEFEG